MAHSIVMPSFGMYTSEGTLVTWLKPSGARIEAGQIIAEIETEKAVQELPAPAAGVLHHVAAVGTVLKEEALLGYVLAEGEVPPGAEARIAGSPPAQAISASVATSSTRAAPIGDVVRASPIAKRLAGENGIELSSIRGTGPGGRIVEGDVAAAIERKKAIACPPAAEVTTSAAVLRRVPLSGLRRTIGERLRHGANNAVALTLTREVEADRLVAARQAFAHDSGISVPFDAYFAKLLAAALHDRPELNSTIEANELVVFAEVNVGVAVSLPDGLIVPVVRCVGQMPLATLAECIRDLATRARAGALRPGDLAGGTCTITNLGGSGIDAFTPVLNPPQSCILGIGRIRPRAVARDGVLVAAQTCVLSLTFDHRVCDGVPAAQLLDSMAQRMNDEAWLARLAEK
jgi:pyruvate dehydrogenase E2 component (dihydrolipoamide acetyltransferase)